MKAIKIVGELLVVPSLTEERAGSRDTNARPWYIYPRGKHIFRSHSIRDRIERVRLSKSSPVYRPIPSSPYSFLPERAAAEGGGEEATGQRHRIELASYLLRVRSILNI